MIIHYNDLNDRVNNIWINGYLLKEIRFNDRSSNLIVKNLFALSE